MKLINTLLLAGQIIANGINVTNTPTQNFTFYDNGNVQTIGNTARGVYYMDADPYNIGITLNSFAYVEYYYSTTGLTRRELRYYIVTEIDQANTQMVEYTLAEAINFAPLTSTSNSIYYDVRQAYDQADMLNIMALKLENNKTDGQTLRTNLNSLTNYFSDGIQGDYGSSTKADNEYNYSQTINNIKAGYGTLATSSINQDRLTKNVLIVNYTISLNINDYTHQQAIDLLNTIKPTTKGYVKYIVTVNNDDYEVIDIPGLMFTILGMPFTWISTAFNFTMFPGTPYAINIGHLFLAVMFSLTLIVVIKLIMRGR